MKNVVVATAVGVRMTELGAFDLVVKDPDGQTHTVVFLPSTAQGLRDLWLKMSQLPWINGWLSPLERPRQNLEARGGTGAESISRMVGSVVADGTDCCAGGSRPGWGGDVDAVGPVADSAIDCDTSAGVDTVESSIGDGALIGFSFSIFPRQFRVRAAGAAGPIQLAEIRVDEGHAARAAFGVPGTCAWACRPWRDNPRFGSSASPRPALVSARHRPCKRL